MNLDDKQYQQLLGANRNYGVAPVVNIGVGEDLTIKELAEMIKETIGFKGEIEFDVSKPDGTLRKLLNVDLAKELGCHSGMSLHQGITDAYSKY